MPTSVFDLFKIGIGPSSSHTVGPMRAALDFVRQLDHAGALSSTRRIIVDLYGSLALTGRGHQTDSAVLRGLAGDEPHLTDPAVSPFAALAATGTLNLLGRHAVPFDPARDLLFHSGEFLPRHPNALRFTAFDSSGAIVLTHIYYSTGGGFIVREGDTALTAATTAVLPYPFSSAQDLLDLGHEFGLPIWALMLANEQALAPGVDIPARLLVLWHVMEASTERGLSTYGHLPGGLKVLRRAPLLRARLRREHPESLESIDWLSLFALAAAEENAAGGRIVTAPTNGAAGVVPAVARYYRSFYPGADDNGIVRFLLTAGAIGILFKENASISGAEVGCQGEIGVACSMAAAGLAGALEATNSQAEHAAEIGMEHHLGLTCDPVAGLVQIPCIERNAIGAVKAATACRLAMLEDAGHKVSLDQVISVMLQTGLDLQARYKETALGGLAIQLAKC